MTDTQGSSTVSTRLQRIAELAREIRGEALTALAHHIDIDFLREAFRRTRKDGATGVDGRTAKEYEENLENNLRGLLEAFKSGTYRAPPVRRVHIPKGDGSKTRPIGIPTFEDKVLQRAVSMVLEAVYEQEFLSCSYGFRPGRSAHQALETLWRDVMKMGGAVVVEVDIQGFFDALDPNHLRSFLDQRVRDGVLRRAIDKWLKAGILEEGQLTRPDTGSPQGGVVSPILSNIYLHYVMDKWFTTVVSPLLHGAASLVRYADDFVLLFESERDAQRVMAVLPRRFGKYGLTLHPEKTRIVDFRKPRKGSRPSGSGPERDTGTFDLLGFTHYWGRSRKGAWVVKRKTAKNRFRRALKSVSEWCRRYRHTKVRDQHKTLVLKLKGHFAYYGITGNGDALQEFRWRVQCVWRKWLDRRSQRAHMDWTRFNRLLERYPLPRAAVVHSVYRLAANP